MQPLVSIIIPTYGGDDTIIRAVKSVLNQTYKNIEVIVVDDNNPDTEARRKTQTYMDFFDNEDRVKYIKHEKNKNGAAARNTGVNAAKGYYICLLDDDDIFYPKKIEKQVMYLENNPSFGACYCWRKQGDNYICGEEVGDLSKSLLDLSFTPTTDALMIKKECYLNLNGFDETYRRHQDFEFMLRFYKKYKIGVVKEVLFEVIGNSVINEPYGQKLYDIKKQFFNQFGLEIEKINNNCPGYKEKVYAEHFGRAFKNMLRHGNILLAIKIYREYGIEGGLEFWRVFFGCCFRACKERISR